MAKKKDEQELMEGAAEAAAVETDPAFADEQQEEAEAVAEEGLVAMEKDGRDIEVHPTCVAAHEAAGWQVKQ
jgi:hypothetical protein